jgi:hypothetical protein
VKLPGNQRVIKKIVFGVPLDNSVSLFFGEWIRLCLWQPRPCDINKRVFAFQITADLDPGVAIHSPK